MQLASSANKKKRKFSILKLAERLLHCKMLASQIFWGISLAVMFQGYAQAQNQCPVLEVPANAQVTYTLPADPTNYNSGTFAIFTCALRYTRLGPLYRFCAGGIWTETQNPVCEASGCPDIGDPVNGNIFFVGDDSGTAPFAVDTLAYYTCNTGYRMEGENIRVCGADINWNGTAATCRPISCPPLGDLINGVVDYDDTQPEGDGNYQFGTTASYRCIEGFGLVGPVKSRCEENGNSLFGAFAPDPPTCELIECDALGTGFPNGDIDYDQDLSDGVYPYGTVAIHSCYPGHILVGSPHRNCTGDGTSTYGYFDGQQPFCQEITCQALDAPEGGQIHYSSGTDESYYDLGIIAVHSCGSGYSLEEGDTERVCQYDEQTNNGVWSGTAPICVGTCEHLAVPDDGSINYSANPDENNEYLAGTLATFVCDEGFELFGDGQRTCQNNMTWNYNQPSCLIACTGLYEIDDGSLTYSSAPNDLGSYASGTTVTYECDVYFRLSGVDLRLCRDDSEWTGYDPVCEPIKCDDIPDPLYGDILFSLDPDLAAPFELGAEAEYVCDSEHVPVDGDEIRVCLANHTEDFGYWNGTAPYCELVTCPALELPEYFSDILYDDMPNLLGKYRHGTEAHYMCQDGYSLKSGDERRECAKDGNSVVGKWSGERPVCQEIIAVCPDLPNPKHGRVSFDHDVSNPLIRGTIAKYSCLLGYGLTGGDEERKCEMDGYSPYGIWRGIEPHCIVVVVCPSLEVPVNGTITYSVDTAVEGIGFGATAVYSCNHESFGMSGGDRVRTCGPAVDEYENLIGIWSGKGSSCRTIECEDIEDPFDGQIQFAPDRRAPFKYGTTAEYSCYEGFALSSADNVRTCVGDGLSDVGVWTGYDYTCDVPPKLIVVDCQEVSCRNEQFVCPYRDNCTVNCYDSQPNACHQTEFICSGGGGECILNCDDENACLQTTATCPSGGNCIMNCPNGNTCQESGLTCSGDTCLLNCNGGQSCTNSIFDCSEGSCDFNCRNNRACSDSTIQCSGEDCLINCAPNTCQQATINCTQTEDCIVSCTDSGACKGATVICPSEGTCRVDCSGEGQSSCQEFSHFTCPEGGNCIFNFFGRNGRGGHGWSTEVTCEENSTCDIICSGDEASQLTGIYICQSSTLTCPRERGECSIECGTDYSCASSGITCGPNGDCMSCSGSRACSHSSIRIYSNESAIVNCTGRQACEHAQIYCPEDNDCTVNCYGESSCGSGTVSCPINSSACEVNCEAENACQSTTISCPPNGDCTVICDNAHSCNDATVTCPTGDYSCTVLCNDPLSCFGLSVTNTHNLYLRCCGSLSCEGIGVVPDSNECPYIDLSQSIPGSINTSIISCDERACRDEQFVCSEGDNCTLNCHDSDPYACYLTEVACPREGVCTLNCDDSYACIQADTICPESGNCILNCANDNSCRHSAFNCYGDSCHVNCASENSCRLSTFNCSGDSCLLSCNGRGSCTNSIVDCSEGSCDLNCRQYACASSNIQCSGENCLINCDPNACQQTTIDCSNSQDCTVSCTDSGACEGASVICPSEGTCRVDCSGEGQASCQEYSHFTCPEGGNCIFNFFGRNGRGGHGWSTEVTCEENSTCDIICSGDEASQLTGIYICQSSTLTCPRERGECSIECGTDYSCASSGITCGPNGDCMSCSGSRACSHSSLRIYSNESAFVNCTGRQACEHAQIYCPEDNDCTVVCDAPSSCNSATVTCPPGDYSCNIYCIDPQSCASLTVTNTHNLYLQCCGSSCAGSSVAPNSNDCSRPTDPPPPSPIGSVENPATSCKDIPHSLPSGYYYIGDLSSPVEVYCDMDRTSCSCNSTGGWTRVAKLNMTDPSETCPAELRTVTNGLLRLCGKPESASRCVSTFFPTYGLQYTHVCGRIVAYHDISPDAFKPYYRNSTLTIDDGYVDGIILTHGESPREHIWTFAAALDETSDHRSGTRCPCINSATEPGPAPNFIGQDYFCDTASRNHFSENLGFYPDDPLWDGQGCSGNSTCCSLNNPPWFCKELSQTTDDIELRMCGDQDITDEDTPIELLELYIR